MVGSFSAFDQFVCVSTISPRGNRKRIFSRVKTFSSTAWGQLTERWMLCATFLDCSKKLSIFSRDNPEWSQPLWASFWLGVGLLWPIGRNPMSRLPHPLNKRIKEGRHRLFYVLWSQPPSQGFQAGLHREDGHPGKKDPTAWYGVTGWCKSYHSTRENVFWE